LRRPRFRIPVATDDWSGKAVSPSDHGFYETRLLRIISQHHADLADGDVDAVIDLNEHVLAPEALRDLIAR
jgi:hypothetical protein